MNLSEHFEVITKPKIKINELEFIGWFKGTKSKRNYRHFYIKSNDEYYIAKSICNKHSIPRWYRKIISKIKNKNITSKVSYKCPDCEKRIKNLEGLKNGS